MMAEDLNAKRPDEVVMREAFSVTIAGDRMSADISVRTPDVDVLPVTQASLQEVLQKHNIVYGIEQPALELILTAPPYEKFIRVANGTPAVDGISASIEYKIKTEVHARPAERQDGSVDYKDMGIIQNVRKGDLLAVKTPVVPGTPGSNIHGAAVNAKQGRDVPLPIGKNTVVSEDALELYAGIDGQADVVNRKVHIQNTYTVNGDVCHATGNINFLGNVVVEGHVHTGFSIKATGNITVSGSVEGANLDADGNIVIREGVNGFGKGMIKAGGYIKCKYIQSANMRAAGEIETDFILHSDVQSGAIIRLTGKKSMLAGGRVSALKRIEAVFAGGRTSLINTILEVGNDPLTLERYHHIPPEIQKCEKDIASLSRAISLLQEYEKKSLLTEEKKEALQKAKEGRQLLSEHLKSLQDENAQVQENLTSFGYGVISIRETAYPGVHIFIGSERMNIESPYSNCSFTRDQSGIQAGPYR